MPKISRHDKIIRSGMMKEYPSENVSDTHCQAAFRGWETRARDSEVTIFDAGDNVATRQKKHV